MKNVGIVIGALGAIIGTFFFLIILNTLLGAISGWVVGLVFGETILAIFAKIGITGFTMFQIGAFLGFVGSFFKTSYHKESNE